MPARREPAGHPSSAQLVAPSPTATGAVDQLRQLILGLCNAMGGSQIEYSHRMAILSSSEGKNV